MERKGCLARAPPDVLPALSANMADRGDEPCIMAPRAPNTLHLAAVVLSPAAAAVVAADPVLQRLRRRGHAREERQLSLSGAHWVTLRTTIPPPLSSPPPASAAAARGPYSLRRPTYRSASLAPLVMRQAVNKAFPASAAHSLRPRI